MSTARKREHAAHPAGACTGALLCRVCAAHYLGGISIDLLDRQRERGLPIVRLGGSVRLARAGLDAWIAQHQEITCPDRPNLPSTLARASGTTDSPAPAGGSVAQRAKEITDELRRSLHGSGTRPTKKQAGLSLVPGPLRGST